MQCVVTGKNSKEVQILGPQSLPLYIVFVLSCLKNYLGCLIFNPVIAEYLFVIIITVSPNFLIRNKPESGA